MNERTGRCRSPPRPRRGLVAALSEKDSCAAQQESNLRTHRGPRRNKVHARVGWACPHVGACLQLAVPGGGGREGGRGTERDTGLLRENHVKCPRKPSRSPYTQSSGQPELLRSIRAALRALPEQAAPAGVDASEQPCPVSCQYANAAKARMASVRAPQNDPAPARRSTRRCSARPTRWQARVAVDRRTEGLSRDSWLAGTKQVFGYWAHFAAFVFD